MNGFKFLSAYLEQKVCLRKWFKSPRQKIQITKWKCKEIGNKAKGFESPWRMIWLPKEENKIESEVEKKIRIPYTKIQIPLLGKWWMSQEHMEDSNPRKKDSNSFWKTKLSFEIKAQGFESLI